jgi:hypothetical protein
VKKKGELMELKKKSVLQTFWIKEIDKLFNKEETKRKRSRRRRVL